ncbi:hypothetical protein AAFO92_12125 [Roseovarius sp. CAU 1744]|uniref:hypothetical protein n=1 Tax=Roseovarius sp. CAU 1744 TaxID=3140368 RepID=UPI00325BC827
MVSTSSVKEQWDVIMDETKNPLKSYSLPTAHMIMQMLAWMWSAIFSVSFGSYYLFGVMAVGHILVIAGLFITLMVFQNANAEQS